MRRVVLYWLPIEIAVFFINHLETVWETWICVQFSRSVVSWLFATPMDCSTPGFPAHHQLQELAQTHVPWVSDAIQSSHSLLSPSPPAPNPSQHQGLFKWVSSSHQEAKGLEFQLQHQSFQWIFRTDFLYDWLVLSPCSPRDSQESSSKLRFKIINSLVLSFFIVQLTSIDYYWKHHSFEYTDFCQ